VTLQTSFVEAVMTDPLIALDRRRGMAAQRATEIRRLLAEVEANDKTLWVRQEALEKQLVAAPAATWPEAAEKSTAICSAFLHRQRSRRTRAGNC